MRIKRKLIIFSIIISLFLMNIPKKVDASISVSARNAVLIEQESGRILFEKAANEKQRIASITKIMTAILAIESDKLQKTVTVSEKAIRTEGSSLYLKGNEKVKLEDLIYGLMLRSGNDAAVAIAEFVGGSLEGFVFLMNQKASEIGMKNTHFANPHGLDDSDQHYSTAYDMAILTRYAMKNDTFKKISGTEVYRTPHPTENWDRIWYNKNKLLTGLYKYSTGGKTGYTKLAKRTLVSTATKGDMDLIAVTLNAPDDWNDHIGMFEYAFENYNMVQVIQPGVIKNTDHKYYNNKVFFEHEVNYPVTPTEENLFRIDIRLMNPKKEWEEERSLPDVVGRATIYFDEKPIKELPIYFKKQGPHTPSFLERFKNLFPAIIGVESDG